MRRVALNDTFRYTRLVIDGVKTQFLEVIACPKKRCGKDVGGFAFEEDNGVLNPFSGHYYDTTGKRITRSHLCPTYSVGEVVAVAQCYQDVLADGKATKEQKKTAIGHVFKNDLSAFYKSLIKAEDMPHRIRIDGVRVMRLQELTDEDIAKEGIRANLGYMEHGNVMYKKFQSDREAFLFVMRREWKSNPFVFIYDFTLLQQ